MIRSLAIAVVLAAVLLPPGANALEPRFDHRDQQGLAVEALIAFDTVAVPGKTSASSWRPALRGAYSWDALGEGNELIVGVAASLAGWSDPARQKVQLAADARYRSYFGTEELKTFLDAGLWLPVRSRLGIGPLVGLGLAYDWSRSGGAYVSAGFASSFGQARIASFTASSGVQLRF